MNFDTLTACVFVFLTGMLIIGVAGAMMTRLADRLADRTGLGEALTGVIFLGLVTALPGVSATITLSLKGSAAMTASNALGGIAVQTTFLAIADIAYRKANLEHAAASLSNMVQTAILIGLLIIILLAFHSPMLTIFHVHPFSFILFIAAISGIMLVSRSRETPMWKPHYTYETVKDEPGQETQNESLTRLLALFFMCAVVVLVSGVFTADAAKNLVDITGLEKTLVGGFFLAFATSLPELITTISAVRIGALTLAVGDIVGGNFFDSLFLAIGDLFYTEGSIYQGADLTHKEPFLAALCVALNVILLIGLLMRQKKGPANIGVESVLILLIYVFGFIFIII